MVKPSLLAATWRQWAFTCQHDGSNLQRLTDTPGHDTLPAYLPNGDLVFRSTRGGSWSIWKMKGDGSDQVEIILQAPLAPIGLSVE
jgi:Tol biopolymer transport system component